MKKIEVMFAFIAQDEDGKGGEGVISSYSAETRTWMPLVGADMDRVNSLKLLAQQLADMTGKDIQLAVFEKRVNLEVIKPKKVINPHDN